MKTVVLTDEQVGDLYQDWYCFFKDNPSSAAICIRTIEKAVLQSDHIRSMQGTAECMAMVWQELIEAGVITEKVPPMFVANAVLTELQALRKEAQI